MSVLPAPAAVARPLAARLLGRGMQALTRLGALAVADQAAVSATTFVTTVAVGRLAGAGELGLFSLGFAVIVVVTAAQEALIGEPYAVFANRSADGTTGAGYAGPLLLHHLLLSVVVAGTLALAAAVPAGAGATRLGPILWVLALAAPMALLRDFCRRLLLADLHVAAALRLDAVVGVLQVSALAWLWSRDRLSAETALAALGAACGVSALGWLVAARSRFALRAEDVRTASRQTLGLGKWILGAHLVSALQAYLVPVGLALAFGAQATGRFTACQTVALLANPLLLSAANILTPHATRALARGLAPAMWRVMWIAVGVLGAVMGLFAAFVALAGPSVVRALYGSDFSGPRSTLTLLALVGLVESAGLVFDAGLRAVGRPALSFRAGVVGLAVTVAAGVVLVVPLGLVGAAGALLVGRVAGSLVRYAGLRRAAKAWAR